MPNLSKVSIEIDQAMSIKYNTMVYELQRMGKDVLIMSLGEAFFDIPLFDMQSLPNPNIYHYSHSMGTAGLREKLAEYFLKEYDIPINYEKELLITAGSKAAIHFALMSIVNPGDEVIVFEPAWVSYTEQIKLCYGTSIQVPYYKNIRDIEEFLTSNTKAVIINHPNNPTGYVYTKDEMNYLLKLATKYDFWILSDEAYSEFVVPETYTSFGKIDRDKKHTVIFNSISKNYGISGWRLGYVIGNENLIHNILKINQHLITCPATILELYVEKYFNKILEFTNPQIEALLVKRNNLIGYMDDLGLKYLPGNATFYFFVSIAPSNLSSEEFCSKLLAEEYIAVVPGLGYGKSCDSFIRISVGTASTDENKYGLRKIKEMIDKTSVIQRKAKSAVVIAGGVWQVPLIDFLKEKQYKVIVVDPYQRSPGVLISDKHIQVDVRHSEKIKPYLNNLKFDFIISDQSDISTNTVSELSEFYNLNSNKFNVTNIFVNKVLMRDHAVKVNVPVPQYKKIEHLTELDAFIEQHGLPIIMKPIDSQSSRGVFKVDDSNIELIEKFYVESLSYTNGNSLIAEQFVEGIEVTVEGFASDYKHISLAISDKKHFRIGIASELNYPAQIEKSLRQKIIEINDNFVNSSGLKFGITHAEYIVDIEKEKVHLVEIACRGGGTLISSDIVPWVTGVNLYELLYNNIIGVGTNLDSITLKNRPASLCFFEFESGKIIKISGVDEAIKIPGVHKLKLFIKEGDVLFDAKDDRSRHGYFIVFAEDKEEIRNIKLAVKKTIEITYE